MAACGGGAVFDARGGRVVEAEGEGAGLAVADGAQVVVEYAALGCDVGKSGMLVKSIAVW